MSMFCMKSLLHVFAVCTMSLPKLYVHMRCCYIFIILNILFSLFDIFNNQFSTKLNKTACMKRHIAKINAHWLSHLIFCSNDRSYNYVNSVYGEKGAFFIFT